LEGNYETRQAAAEVVIESISLVRIKKLILACKWHALEIQEVNDLPAILETNLVY
jgi:hypothetical protein